VATNTVVGGAGADTLSGGNGTDLLDYSSSVSGVTFPLTDPSTIPMAMGSTDNLAATFENVTGGSGNDTLSGDSSGNVISGNGGDDTIVGGAGADTLSGGSGTDLLDYSLAPAAVNISLDGTVNDTGWHPGSTDNLSATLTVPSREMFTAAGAK